ncbi:MAG: HNH endonuclease, partial [Bifidobacteriaceae bacterium]|nr:HNH endonuclease [Bifidobacteriaceae bacterium]
AADKARRQTKDAPGAPLVERRQARADALVGLCRHAQGCRRAAALGAAGARVVVTIQATDLADGANARVEGTGERLDPGVFARLACDSDVMRVVLGAKGEVLDVGRATRAIPRGLRAAVVARDRGCSFPGCDRPPEVCECHHVVPWKQGGDTKLSNLCLLCPAHHRLVEPPKGRDPDWVLDLREDGLWEFRPPAWYDPERTPLMHHRHRKPGPVPGI